MNTPSFGNIFTACITFSYDDFHPIIELKPPLIFLHHNVKWNHPISEKCPFAQSSFCWLLMQRVWSVADSQVEKVKQLHGPVTTSCSTEIPWGDQSILQTKTLQIHSQVQSITYFCPPFSCHCLICLILICIIGRSMYIPVQASDDDYIRLYKTEKKKQELDDLVEQNRKHLTHMSLKLIL